MHSAIYGAPLRGSPSPPAPLPQTTRERGELTERHRLPLRVGLPVPPLPRSWGRGRPPLRGTSKRRSGEKAPVAQRRTRWRRACNLTIPYTAQTDTRSERGNVSDNVDPRRDDSLREGETEAERLAANAQHFRDENERAMDRGQETGYAFRLPPDVAHADRVRAADDVELADRQESMAETQRRATEALRRNAEMLEGTARELDRAGEAVRDNRGDLRDVQQNVEALQAQTDQTREMVDRAEIPDVDRDGHEGGNGRDEGDRRGNG